MGRRYFHLPKYSVAKPIDAPIDENTLNSRKTQEKRALFGFKGAGKVSKQKALSGKVEKK